MPTGGVSSSGTLVERPTTFVIAQPLPLARLLLEIANDPKARNADRIAAARELLDRGWGKASKALVPLSRTSWTRLFEGSSRNSETSKPSRASPKYFPLKPRDRLRHPRRG